MKADWKTLTPEQSLTDDQKSTIEESASIRHGGLVMLYGALKAMDPARTLPRLIEADAIVSAMDDETVLPLLTGHGGAKPPTKKQFLAVGKMLAELLVVYEKHAAEDPSLIVDVIGTANV